MKFYRTGDVVFMTTSVEQGIMFPPNPLIELVLQNCLAEAQQLYDLEVNHLLVNSTHAHFLVYVENPSDVCDFMKQFKTESAHAINRLLGWDKRTIWCSGYDSPTLLTPEDVQKKIAYIYANPSNDNLADKIQDYRGFSTWQAFSSGGHTGKSKHKNHYTTCYLARTDYPYIAHKLESLKIRDYQKVVRKITYQKEKIDFRINPDGWAKAFPELDEQGVERINKGAIKLLEKAERANRQKRQEEAKTIIPHKVQRATLIGAPYQPKRDGRRMRCHSDDLELRKAYIECTNYLKKEGRRIRQNWLDGDFSEEYPAGLFPPSFPKMTVADCSILSEMM